ncbi:hypothetical protein [Maridesulfovibrio ferrireducens]|uniref:hypothetical protein n=1 Tax=Maridesulfovibrio ferrireducens TaxID=246191 RepID=UPI001A212A93|nr:hypothetical protein [Maridesulfovibrio ferrireducens]MBI9111478.1 hypothetical protein [Maridesulfovibrio ferrireducens]
MPQKIFRMLSSIMFLVLVMLFSTSPAQAHRVSVFAYVEGSEVFTESYFSKEKRVHQGKIEVFNLTTGSQILTGTSDDDGNFNFPIPKEISSDHAGLKIVLIASEGHRNEWTLTPEDIFPNASPTSSELPQKMQTEIIPDVKTTLTNTDTSLLSAQIQELNTKIDTLKRLILNQQEDGPGIKEIFSGIGYIFGFFGIAAFLTSRKK